MGEIGLFIPFVKIRAQWHACLHQDYIPFIHDLPIYLLFEDKDSNQMPKLRGSLLLKKKTYCHMQNN